ncbi:ATP-dependent helicase [Mycoplasmopsis glycophila]|uniref:DNA 3'-5' helicase n=1 Tax=Mycoplasmopsis glycophila TaxID=171285 RepID=A0A449AVC6_9BACT|nr:UvrD-helicase domain-containing protein [Mycoplasmopsis glycophila]VEU70422.1 ATP-dependent DNA helicase UvrD/PcrA [Mycoplasmopsis glycophila]
MLKKINLLADLNEKQKAAVEYFDTPLRIIAGAGTGKTKVLTRKVAYLINDLGISPNNILGVTFTNKACNEMMDRISNYINSNDEQKVQIYTFHSFCAKVLRKHIRALGFHKDFLIIDEVDQKQILSEIYNRLGVSTNEISYKNMIQYISWAKSFDLSREELADKLKQDHNDLIPTIYQNYLNELAAKGSVDFDDLIIYTHMLFKQRPDIAEQYKKQFSYILIDEFQDTSVKQYEIIKAIVGENTHLTIVGDPDQTIYNWRGADVNLILDFDKDYPNAKTIVLDINYRSTREILQAANNLIKHNKNRFHKDLITNQESGEPIEFYHGFNVEAEARWVVQKINELKKQKNQLKNIAILYRSNYYSRPFEEALINEGINHKIFNGTKFFQRSEIKDAIAFLRVLDNGQTVALERIINVPSRGIGAANLQKLSEYAKSKQKTLFNCLKEDIKTLPVAPNLILNSIYPFVKTILQYRTLLKKKTQKIHVILDSFLQEISYYEHIEDNKNLRGSAVDNVKELINSIQTWEAKNPDKTVEDYLNMVSLLSVSDEYDNIPNYVSLMTIHSSKGLEYDNIFLVGLSEGVFPTMRALDSTKSKKKNNLSEEMDGLEEERRLAYVAATRARKKLFVSDARGKIIGTEIIKEPSRFIKEMGIDINKVILYNSHTEMDDLEEQNEEVIKSLHKNIIVGDIISHVVFGEGEVIDVNSNEIVVEFVKNKDVKTLNKFHPSIKVISK